MTGREAAGLTEHQARHPRRSVDGPAPDAAALDAAGAESLADVVERLATAFDGQVRPPVIVAVVRRCRRELDIVSGPPLPELLERLARQRLVGLARCEMERARR